MGVFAHLAFHPWPQAQQTCWLGGLASLVGDHSALSCHCATYCTGQITAMCFSVCFVMHGALAAHYAPVNLRVVGGAIVLTSPPIATPHASRSWSPPRGGGRHAPVLLRASFALMCDTVVACPFARLGAQLGAAASSTSPTTRQLPRRRVCCSTFLFSALIRRSDSPP